MKTCPQSKRLYQTYIQSELIKLYSIHITIILIAKFQYLRTIGASGGAILRPCERMP